MNISCVCTEWCKTPFYNHFRDIKKMVYQLFYDHFVEISKMVMQYMRIMQQLIYNTKYYKE
nr:MAG TPA: Putative regulatory protein binding pocket, HTH-MOTIF, DNA [Caudoviricetes sp.]